MFDDSSAAQSTRRYSSVPASAQDSSPALAVPPATLLLFCERLADLPRHATGTLVFGSAQAPVGRILFEQGHVSWAAAQNMRRRLTDLLCHQQDPPIDPERVEKAYAECVAQRGVFSDYLVQSGLVTVEGMRRALRQHFAESMALLSDPALAVTWVSGGRSDYDPRFTFSTGELLTNLGALWDMDAAYRATARLRRVAEPGACVGVGFVRTHSSDLLPIAHSYSGSVSAVDLLALGKWVTELPGLLRDALESPEFASYKRADGCTALGWTEGRIGYALVCNSAAAVSQVMSRILTT
jgi:hypothetical protein